MTPRDRPHAHALLGAFLDDDPHYRASSVAYGDGGPAALARSLDLFVAHPELGFVWLAFEAERAIGACVVCRAISTSRGGIVAKLDDVTVHASSLGRGVGTRMLGALVAELAREGITRIDTACHRGNARAWRFYERLGFRSLDEERIALLIARDEQLDRLS
jgi:GNAT superfamily N-acetyltransferase